ncbi:MAG: peptide ABC transporter substrate-binding protein [Tissierellia bacterium]|nr:peptide ABC transporter substrate-binding protein [Tissierellia bacterium]
MNKRSLKWITLLLAMVIFLTACGGGGNNAPANNANNGNGGNEATESAEGGEGKILRTNNHSEPGSLDPALARGTHESWILQHIFEGLMKYNEKNEVVPAMAEKVDVSDDGITYTFHLRDDVKWSNGDPVTAEDFEFAWKRVLDPELGSEYSFQLYYVQGGEEYNTGEGSVDDVAIKALDEKTLEVKLVVPTPYFEGLTAFYTLYPVHKASVEGNEKWAGDPKNTEFVCNGPFKLTDWQHNEKVILEKNDNYYDADKVKLAGIDFDIIEDDNTAWQKYDGGDYDFLMSPPSTIVAQLKGNDDEQLKIGDDLGTYYYAFNCKKAPFTNAKVREALSLTIDRKTIVENITQGGQIPAEGIVPYGLLDDTNTEFREANGNLIKEDPENAKKLLEEGLKEENMTIEDFNKQGFILSYNTDEGHKKIAQAVQQMWKEKLGVEIGLENMEFQVLLDNRMQGNYDIVRAGWLGDYADPMTMMDLFMTDNPQNDVFWSNPEFDKLLQTAKSSPDQKLRMDSMKKAEQIMMEEKPVAPVYFYTRPYVEKPYVKGVYNTILNYPFLTYAEIEDAK